jgi:hypothetical protein
LRQAPRKKKGLGFSLRRTKPEATTPDGCEPKVFADEIEEYLARAAEEKRLAAENEANFVPRPDLPDEVAIPAAIEEQWTPAYSSEAPIEHVNWGAAQSDADDWRREFLNQLIEEKSAECQERIPAVPAPHQENVGAPVVELPGTSALAAIDETEITDNLVVKPATAEEPLVDEVSFEQPATAEPAPAEDEVIKASPSFKAALAAIRAAWGKPARKAEPVDAVSEGSTDSVTRSSEVATAWGKPAGKAEPVNAVSHDNEDSVTQPSEVPVEVDLTGAVEMLDEQPSVPADQPAREGQTPLAQAAMEALEVYELSVEPDLRELESQFFTPVPPPPKREASARWPAALATPEEKVRAESSVDRRKKESNRATKKAAKGKSRRQQPAPQPQPEAQPDAVQDEWGIFDPNRCGFAALVDKLDEVADKKPERRPTGKVRVISYS